MLQCGKDRFFGKIITQLTGRDRLRALRRQIAETTTAFFHRNAVILQKCIKEIFQRSGFLERGTDLLTQDLLVRFKLRLLWFFSVCDQLGVFFVELFLPLLLCPILAFGNSVIAAVEQIDLIQPLPLAHLHHFRAEITERCGCTSVLHSGEHIAVLVHVRHPGNALDAQTVDDDMHMDVAAFVVAVRVRRDQSLMAGEMFFAKLQAQLMRAIHRQAVIFRVAGIEADDVMMRLDITAGEIFVIGKIRFHAGNRKILVAAEDGIDAVILARDQMAVSIQDRLVAALVVLKDQVTLGGPEVRVFRAQMFDRCQWRCPPPAGFHISIPPDRRARGGSRP